MNSLSLDNAGSGNAGVGHYKGVMLCNRPFGGTMVSQKSLQSTSDGQKAFACGVNPSPMGLNVPIPMKEKQVKRPKKDSVLVKHKKWLSDLQKTKESLEQQYVGELQQREETKLKFQESQRKMREMTKTILQIENGEDKEYKNNNNTMVGSSSSNNMLSQAESKSYPTNNNNNNNNNNHNNNQDEDKPNFSAQDKGYPNNESKKIMMNKPAWALTEKSAEDVSDMKTQQEEDDLLAFASSLNYDKFIYDIEVQSTIQRLRKRIEELEHDSTNEEQRQQETLENRIARKEMLELMGNVENNLLNIERKVDEKTLALQTAKALLGEEDSLQNVHSTQSVAVLLKAAKEKINTVASSVRPLSQLQPAEPKVVNEPKIVIHDPSEGARLEAKKAIDKLPYMHRNPAV